MGLMFNARWIQGNIVESFFLISSFRPFWNLKPTSSVTNPEWRNVKNCPSRVQGGFKRISRNWPAPISTIALSVEDGNAEIRAAYRDRQEEFEKVSAAGSELTAFFHGHKGKLHAREMYLAPVPIRRRVMRPESVPPFCPLLVNGSKRRKKIEDLLINLFFRCLAFVSYYFSIAFLILLLSYCSTLPIIFFALLILCLKYFQYFLANKLKGDSSAFRRFE